MTSALASTEGPPHLGPELMNQLVSFFEFVKKQDLIAKKENGILEVECRIGKIEKGVFVSGVSNGRFRFFTDWMDQSNLNAVPWKESVSSFFSKNVRCTTQRGENSPEIIDKKVLKTIVLISNHPEGVAVKFSAAIEYPAAIPFLPSGAQEKPSWSRLRQRRSYCFHSRKIQDAWRFDFTLAWKAQSERGARQLQRECKDTSYEIELEINPTYLTNHLSDYIAKSFSMKIASLYDTEMQVPFEFVRRLC